MGCAASRIDTSLEELYKIKALIGDGAEATVWLGQSFASRTKYALKLIPCNQEQPGSSRNIERRNVLNEAQSLAWLGAGHVNVVSLEEVVLTEHNVALVMEYVSGGTLAHLSCRHKMSEHEALYYFKQMVSAVEFCHQHHVAHRDLKLENILLDTTANPPRIKIADFGLSKHWEPASNRLCRMNTCAGTPGYISPEVAGTILHAPGSSYDGTKADVWALGVALVGMLLHHLPFAYSQLRHLSVKALLRNMHHQQLHTRWLDTPAIREHLAALSAPLRDLLTHIFLPDATQRISLADVQRHPWLHQPLPRHYQAALDAMAAEQAARTRRTVAAVPGAATDDMVLSKPVREQLHVLQAQLEAGGVPPGCVGRVKFAPWQWQDAPQHNQQQQPGWHYVAADERQLKDQAHNPLARRPPQHQQQQQPRKTALAQHKAAQRERSDKAERVPRPGASPLATAHL